MFPNKYKYLHTNDRTRIVFSPVTKTSINNKCNLERIKGLGLNFGFKSKEKQDAFKQEFHIKNHTSFNFLGGK